MVDMIGAMEKGIEAAQVVAPPLGTYDGVNLSVLPKYICFKAALLHNRLTQQYIILLLAAFFTAYFIVSRVEVNSLYGKLRQKEYILAPGVQDFTPASPDTVTEEYVSSAVSEFLEQLGNTTPGNIDEQYKNLTQSMSPQLKVIFLSEAELQKANAKAENISELLSVTSKEIRPSGDGFYQVVAHAKRDTYINNEYLGHKEEVIEMVMQLIPPKAGRRWCLQINSLRRQSPEAFNGKSKL